MAAKKKSKDGLPAMPPSFTKPKGRTPTPIDWEDFEKLCALQCTEIEIASWFGLTIDAFDYRVKQQYGGRSLSEIRQEKAAKGKISLRRAQFQTAQGGSAALLIWLGKQWLEQRERMEMAGVDGGPIQTENVNTHIVAPLGLTPDEVASRLKAALAAVDRVRRKGQEKPPA